MILKVKSEVEGSNNSWRFYDGCEGLHYTLYDSASDTKKNYAQCGVPSDVHEVWYEYNLRPQAMDQPILLAAFSSQTTGPVHLFCSTECYLLNDLGKTIERLI